MGVGMIPNIHSLTTSIDYIASGVHGGESLGSSLEPACIFSRVGSDFSNNKKMALGVLLNDLFDDFVADDMCCVRAASSCPSHAHLR